MASCIRWLEALGLEDVPLVGGKNASLGELYRALAPEHGFEVMPAEDMHVCAGGTMGGRPVDDAVSAESCHVLVVADFAQLAGYERMFAAHADRVRRIGNFFVSTATEPRREAA